ncbi:MAG TPA: sulfotransferase [Casimicrobiaceae bacterium]|nr:sulfotransferase [Casimicrobiaceae bacterium]
MTAVKKVGFLVAGAQKSGTSALDAYLRDHPELCLPREKELHFFDKDRLFAVEPVDYAAYHAQFDPRPPQHLLGESTPAYLYWPQALERIARYNPAMRFIIVLRNPVMRAFSHWNYERVIGREPLSFLDALRAYPERQRTLSPNRAKRFAYVDRGYYVRQLERLRSHFPVEQTAIFKSEQLLEEPKAVLERVAAFLDIAPFPPLAAKTRNAREYSSAMSEEEKRYLVSLYESEIRELERLLGWDCSTWLS